MIRAVMGEALFRQIIGVFDAANHVDEVVDINLVTVECHDDAADDSVDLSPVDALKCSERGLYVARNGMGLRPVYALDLDVRAPVAHPPPPVTATRGLRDPARYGRQHGRCMRDHPGLWPAAHVAATKVLAGLAGASGLPCVLFSNPGSCRDQRGDRPVDDTERGRHGKPAPPQHVPGPACRKADVRHGKRGHRDTAPAVGRGRPLRGPGHRLRCAAAA